MVDGTAVYHPSDEFKQAAAFNAAIGEQSPN
jgi:hypothetical protein